MFPLRTTMPEMSDSRKFSACITSREGRSFVSRTRVVVVDDVDAVRLLLSRTLPLYDIDVVGEADTLGGGIRVTEREQPDVVLLDEHLPDGLGTTGLLRFRSVSPRSKILMFTNDDSGEALSRAAAGGAEGYILKISLIPDIVREIERVAQLRIENRTSSEPNGG